MADPGCVDCPNCGEDIELTANFCTFCGSARNAQPRGNPYQDLVDLVSEIASEFPAVEFTMRSLKGTEDAGDYLCIDRNVGGDTRAVRIPATRRAVRPFFSGSYPPPGERRTFPRHSEGTGFGDWPYVRYFVRAFLFELEVNIRPANADGSLPSGEG